MPGRFPFVKQSKYPHMDQQDIKVWERFIEKYPDYYDSVDYDVRVGEGREYPMAEEGPYKEDMKLLTQLRIDAVGYKGDEIHIIEVKPRLSFTALGQTITYTNLYAKTYPVSNRLIPVVVAEEEVPDVRKTADDMGITVLLDRKSVV